MNHDEISSLSQMLQTDIFTLEMLDYTIECRD